MAKVIPPKVSEAKVSYVLYPFDRATTSKAFSASKKTGEREKNGQREGCRSASRSHGRRQNLEQHFPSLAFIEKNNLGDEIPITLLRAKIGF